jgi:SAM-dependent methyltransferase
MSYWENTFNDRNPMKRWLQRKRLVSALELAERFSPNPRSICDFAAGDGELCKSIVDWYPDAKVICYEPAPTYLVEARKNLRSLPTIAFSSDVCRLASQSVDLVFCLEVLEHLPRPETVQALQQIDEILAPDGIAVIGVPIEIGIPAVYKGVFRIVRRHGAFDATLGNVLRAAIGNPPKSRPLSEVSSGLKFHHEHMGFDFRQLKQMILRQLSIEETAASPYPILGSTLMPEIYFVARKFPSKNN